MTKLMGRHASKTIAFLVLVLLTCGSGSAEDRRFIVPETRTHSAEEIVRDVGFLYATHWAGYVLLFKVIGDRGGTWETYRKNSFLKSVQCWDNDSFWWNFVAHPYIGSQTYLYYRARGYSRSASFWGSFTASFLFESTIESFHTGFSANDAIITPTLGYVLGNWLEKKSIQMVNSDSQLQRTVASILNPWFNFDWYEGIDFLPGISSEKAGLVFCYEF